MSEDDWIDVASVADLKVARNKLVVDLDGAEVLVLLHGDQLRAFVNRCVHKQRSLDRGVVLNGKLVCPGHQWAFSLEDGWEAIKLECQPMHPVRISGDRIEVGRGIWNARRPDAFESTTSDL